MRASLIAVSVLCGLLSAWVFRHTTDLSAVRASRRRLTAYLMELRLFSSEPWLIWRAQKALVRENVHMCILLLRPALILALPMSGLWYALDAIYGWEPLLPGEAAVVTAQLNRPVDAADAQDRLEAPLDIKVETPPVRSTITRQISWRVRPLKESHGRLRFSVAFPGPRSRRSSDLAWIAVQYPRSNWLFWFLSISTLSGVVSALWMKL